MEYEADLSCSNNLRGYDMPGYRCGRSAKVHLYGHHSSQWRYQTLRPIFVALFHTVCGSWSAVCAEHALDCNASIRCAGLGSAGLTYAQTGPATGRFSQTEQKFRYADR